MDEGTGTGKGGSAGGQDFDCATWLHQAEDMPKEDFKRGVEKELTGRETESWEIIHFKLFGQCARPNRCSRHWHPGAWVIGNNHGAARLRCCSERPIRMTCHINPAIPTMPAAQPNFI